MATGWILNKVSEALQPTISNTVSTAGGFAGDLASAVGTSINGVGFSINDAIRRYGDAAINSGNGIKDWTGAPGSRVGTATNPLGLSDTKTGGRRAIAAGGPKRASTWAPAAPSAPSSLQKALPTSKPASSKTKAAVPAKPSTVSAKSRPSPVNTSRPPTTSTAGKTSSTKSAKSPATPNSSQTSSYKSPSTATSKTPVSSRTPMFTPRPKVAGTTASAKNPLGL